MLDFINNFTPILYLIFPFIFLFMVFINNSIVQRRATKIFAVLNLIFTTYFIFNVQISDFSFLGISFYVNDFSNTYLILSALGFFLFTFFSKTSILKLHKLFYLTSILSLGLINLFILCDNIFVSFIALFWLSLIDYLFKTSFSYQKENSKIKLNLIKNFIVLFCAFSLISYDFARYFFINEIEFNFSILKNYLGNIEEFSIILAFFGFVLILFRLFNFILFSNHQEKEINKINSFILCVNSCVYVFLGLILFNKIYPAFSYLFFEYQNYFALFLIISFFYYAFLSSRSDNILKILHNIFFALVSFGIMVIFCFDRVSLISFNHFEIMLILAFALSNFVFIAIEKKSKMQKILDFENLCKISSNDRLIQILIFLSLFFIAPIPFLNVFLPVTVNLALIFATQFEGVFLNIAVYFLIIGLFILSSTIINLIYKILIEPIKKTKNSIKISYHQKFVLAILIFAIILLGIFKLDFLIN